MRSDSPVIGVFSTLEEAKAFADELLAREPAGMTRTSGLLQSRAERANGFIRWEDVNFRNRVFCRVRLAFFALLAYDTDAGWVGREEFADLRYTSRAFEHIEVMEVRMIREGWDW